jgi:hypothetical protein
MPDIDICPACGAVAQIVRGEYEMVHDDDCDWFHGARTSPGPYSPWCGTEVFDG